jgi:hypothetical protein
MITLTLNIPTPVAAEYFEAAEELNRRFGGTNPRIEAKTLMALRLAGHSAEEICANFDLALRIGVQLSTLPNPVVSDFPGRN